MVLQTEAVHSQHSFIQFIHSFIKKPNVHTTLRYFKWFEWHGFQPGFALQTEAVRSQHSFIHSVHSFSSFTHQPSAHATPRYFKWLKWRGFWAWICTAVCSCLRLDGRRVQMDPPECCWNLIIQIKTIAKLLCCEFGSDFELDSDPRSIAVADPDQKKNSLNLTINSTVYCGKIFPFYVK